MLWSPPSVSALGSADHVTRDNDVTKKMHESRFRVKLFRQGQNNRTPEDIRAVKAMCNAPSVGRNSRLIRPVLHVLDDVF